MNATDHDELRDWAGAYTIGALEPGDRRRFEAHLRDCMVCQQEVNHLAVLPGLLARVEPTELDDTPDPVTAAAIGRRARDELIALRASRTRWRTLAAAMAVAACVVVGFAIATRPGQDAPADSVAVAVSASAARSAEIRADPKGWGTALHARLGGLPERDAYQMWAVGHDGSWIVAATWGPTISGEASVTGATPLHVDELARILVTSTDRADVLVDAELAG